MTPVDDNDAGSEAATMTPVDADDAGSEAATTTPVGADARSDGTMSRDSEVAGDVGPIIGRSLTIAMSCCSVSRWLASMRSMISGLQAAGSFRTWSSNIGICLPNSSRSVCNAIFGCTDFNGNFPIALRAACITSPLYTLHPGTAVNSLFVRLSKQYLLLCTCSYIGIACYQDGRGGGVVAFV